MATPADEAAAVSAAETVQSEHEEPDKEQEEVGEADEEQEEEIEDEEGVEMFMTDNWDVVDEASGSEHDDDEGEIDHDIEIDDNEMPTGPEYEADGDLEDDMEPSYDDEHIEEEGNIQEETGELDESDQKEDSSSAKQTDVAESNESKTADVKSKDTLDKDENKTESTEENADQKQAGDKDVNTDGDDAEKGAAEVKGDDADKSDKKESGDSGKDGTEEKNSKDKVEGEEKTATKKVEKNPEGGKKDTAKSKGDKKDAGKGANSRAEAKARAEAEAKARAEARAKADARRKAEHEAMTKEWDNLVVTLSEVEVRNFKADDFFLCLCKAKEIHIDFEDLNGMRTLGKMKVAFNASSPVRYESLVKSLANLRLLGIKIDECSEHLLKKTNDFCRRLGLQEGHPRDRSLFLKSLPEDTTDLSLKEYIPNMVRACVARKPGGKVVGWAVVEMPTKSECLAFLHENKFIKIGSLQVRVSRMTSIGKPEIPSTPRVQQWLWGKPFYLSDKRREYWNNKKNVLQDSRPTQDRRPVGRFSRGNFRDNKFLNTRGRRPNMRGTGLRSGMNLGMRTNMGIPGLNVSLGAANMGGMGMGPSNMGNMMGQGMGGNMGGLNMRSTMGMGNMGMASSMGGMGTGMMGNMGGAGVGMGMGGNSMGGLNMNQGMGQMGSDMRQMRSNISSRSRSRDRLDRSPSQGRGFGSDRSFSDQRQRRSTGGTMETGRLNNGRGSSRDGGMRRTSDINVRPSRGNRGNFTQRGSYSGGRGGNYRGGRDSRSNFDSGRDEGFDRNRSPVRSRRDSGDLSRDYRDYNKGGHFSDHSDYEDDYNRGGSHRSRDDDYDREYDRPSRSSDRMGPSSAPKRQQQQITRRRERSPVWDDRDYDSHDMGLDDDSRGRGVKKTASRRDLSEKLGVVLSNERQGVQDDRAMVALLQTALDAMQKKEGSKSPARGSASSSLGRPVAVPSTRRANPVALKRRKPYDEDHSQMQKRPREEFSPQSSTMGRTSTMGSGGYSGGQTSYQYRSPIQNQYSASKPSFGATRGGVSRGGRGSMRGGNMRGAARGAARGTTRGGPSRGGAGRGGYNQGGNRQQMGMGGSQGIARNYDDY
ncbi:uncharacterized protein LOC110466940 isoform X2 [Mizuhopecten yessoensis]|uniref:uncharacterized protein LOC110466940 isoform X2 n=1 Tax=Mizuhopecten yessoensis TaxID=6573 RepID=UPI000B4576B3|nr:uncharacterized protein LOC110466940 isoform X2 [Mizuhopecten yessoensis]